MYVADGLGSGKWTNLVGGATVVIITKESDFPVPVAGEILLADNVGYIIRGKVAITSTIRPGLNSSISATGSLGNELNYTGTGSMFKGVNKSLCVSNITLRCANGTLHDWVDVAPLKTSVIEFNRVVIAQVKTIGLCTDIKQLRYFACVFDDIITTGHTFSGNLEQIFAVDTDFVMNGPSPIFDLGTSISELVWVIDFQVKLNNASSNFLKGIAGNANLSASGFGQLLIGLFLGAGTPLSGVSVSDTRWNFQDNNTLPSTNPSGLVSLVGNAVATDIITQSVYVKVAGTWTPESAIHFTGSTGGRLTYNGSVPVLVTVAATSSVAPISGTNKIIALQLAKNGTTIPNTKRIVKANSGEPTNLSLNWQLTLLPNDFIELFVANDSDSIDVLVSSAGLMVD